MFEDEARFGRINDPRRCWAPEGLRPEVPVQIVREYTYLFGAVSPHDGVLDTLILPEVNAEAMSVFLAEVAQHHRQDYILLVQHPMSTDEVFPACRLLSLRSRKSVVATQNIAGRLISQLLAKVGQGPPQMRS
jgi:hypothetical protein